MASSTSRNSHYTYGVQKKYLQQKFHERVKTFKERFPGVIAPKLLEILKEKLSNVESPPTLDFHNFWGRGVDGFDGVVNVLGAIYGIIQANLPRILTLETSDRHIQILLETFSELESAHEYDNIQNILQRILGLSLLPPHIQTKQFDFHEISYAWDNDSLDLSGSESSLSRSLLIAVADKKTPKVKNFQNTLCLIDFIYEEEEGVDVYQYLAERFFKQISDRKVENACDVPIAYLMGLGKKLSAYVEYDTFYKFQPEIDLSKRISDNSVEFIRQTNDLVAISSNLLRQHRRLGDDLNLSGAFWDAAQILQDILRFISQTIPGRLKEIHPGFNVGLIFLKAGMLIRDVLLFWYKQTGTFNQTALTIRNHVIQPIITLAKTADRTVSMTRTTVAQVVSKVLMPDLVQYPKHLESILSLGLGKILFKCYVHEDGTKDYSQMLHMCKVLTLLVSPSKTLGSLTELMLLTTPIPTEIEEFELKFKKIIPELTMVVRRRIIFV